MTEQILSDADTLAARVGENMIAKSPVLQHWGIELTGITAGTSEMRMTIREDMVNLHRQCHGGVLFTMADGCFGFASNSYNDRTVAASCDINFLKPAEVGDVVTARSVEVWKRGRSGFYDVTLTNQNGEKIAIMRAHARMTKGTHIELE
jgi:acyl-CoA thioesterase